MENTTPDVTTSETPAETPVATASEIPSAAPLLKWHTKLVLALLVFTPLFFMVAALGTKIGLWSWQTGLGTLTIGGGPIILGLTGVAALVSLGLGVFKKPRSKRVLTVAAIGLLVPLGAFAMLGMMSGTAADNPIHDVATDTANPPSFSPETIRARLQAEANPLSDYQLPLGEIEMYSSSAPELAIKSHAQIINDAYAELSPLPLGGASRADAVAAVAAAMGEMGFADIRTDAEAGRVEGVAETFWFGFKDDVVARVGENQIDFRSVSRVGRSDLGANAARIAELRELVAQQIGQR
ncbi:DUF1499 domain-containing protein [uncultured Erythrobacter sp.]|uniref:DUF1499 domain-containing protein n=1 Tax=uncultured Erythrobacter sp. TaxID=263913 RepID=UPI0026359B9D|nr:DUF1499 domain-containing protein [uncultured Erythrobacter sp.]